jgi:hypothetical protein
VLSRTKPAEIEAEMSLKSVIKDKISREKAEMSLKSVIKDKIS